MPWSSGDVTWFILWLTPVWLVLLGPLGFLLSLVKPRKRVLAELKAALDRVEAVDISRRFGDADVTKVRPQLKMYYVIMCRINIHTSFGFIGLFDH